LDAALADDPVPVFFIDPTQGWDARRRSVEEEELGRVQLYRIAAASGGCGGGGSVTPEEMRAVAGELSDVIRTPYMLYFAASTGTLPRSKLTVEPAGVKPKPRLLYDAKHLPRWPGEP